MILQGSLINGAAVLVFASLGALIGKKLPERVCDTILKGLSLCIIFIGIDGAFAGENILITIISIAIGGLVGELIDIDKYLNRFGDFLQSKLVKGSGKSTFGEGFVSASLLICVGAWAITGAMDAGLKLDHTSFYAKAVTDSVSTFVLATTLGFGVAFSAVTVALYQGSLALLSTLIAPYLTDYVIGELGCVGSLLIIAIGLNMLGITKIKVVNLLPAVLIPFILCLFM